ncbi:hypothetical protein C0Q70_15905 [Pomacea canaliculata]|uniref:Endonuclease/exonuclease/phosphatase domain-containing protein n=1 Tax=Pomacea canaliculata TaxID=400727 RepID=A0A2T7NNA4_POMCA|nr:hypothetical protein C0Q70_15905 [Pomacea canaliculata]
MTHASESLLEVSLPTHLLTARAKSRIGTWNIRTLYERGKSAQVAQEMKNHNIKLLGLCETRRNGNSLTRLASGETIIYSGHEDPDHDHTKGFTVLMTPEAARALIAWEPVSPRLMSARFNFKGRKITIIQCYAPTSEAKEEEKEDFHNSLQALVDRTPK